MSDARPRWWAIRRAQNLSGSLYTCPLCRQPVPALMDHLLISPEGNPRGRRHAHTDCVMETRRKGEMPTHDEWQKTQPQPQPKRRRWFTRRPSRDDPS